MLGSNQRPPPCKGRVILFSSVRRIANCLQMSVFSGGYFSGVFSVFAQVAARLLHKISSSSRFSSGPDKLEEGCFNCLGATRETCAEVTVVLEWILRMLLVPPIKENRPGRSIVLMPPFHLPNKTCYLQGFGLRLSASALDDLLLHPPVGSRNLFRRHPWRDVELYSPLRTQVSILLELQSRVYWLR